MKVQFYIRVYGLGPEVIKENFFFTVGFCGSLKAPALDKPSKFVIIFWVKEIFECGS